MSGHAHAFAAGIVLPSVVGTLQAPVKDTSARKLCATMKAQVLPCAKALLAPPKDEILAQEPSCADASVSHLRGSGNDVPVIHQNWIIDHDDACIGFAGLRLPQNGRVALYFSKEHKRISQANVRHRSEENTSQWMGENRRVLGVTGWRARVFLRTLSRNALVIAARPKSLHRILRQATRFSPFSNGGTDILPKSAAQGFLRVHERAILLKL